jgi:hypothetical protein
LYVDAFPAPRARARLTVGGGTEPRWAHDGTRLFFRRGPEVHVVALARNGEALEAVSTTRLFAVEGEIRGLDVSADSTRVLVNVAAPGPSPKPMTVLVNVRSLLPSAP